ncbi:MAG: carboxymuconolactone decarboxylase family protein [Acidimicrobiales bacterium]|jgi:AhpD family alkylhydroperoxidase
MQSRMTNPALSVPGVLDALPPLSTAASEAETRAGVPQSTIDLVGLRASQINGCAVRLDMHSRAARKAGEADSASSPWRPGARPQLQ